MYVDDSLVLDDGNALAGTGPSQKAVDFGAVQDHIGVGTPIGVAVKVTVAPAVAGTYQVDLRTGDAYANGAITAPRVVLSRKILATASAGDNYWLDIPAEVIALLGRYVDLNYTLGGVNPTITVSASIKPRNFQENVYTVPNGYTILA